MSVRWAPELQFASDMVYSSIVARDRNFASDLDRPSNAQQRESLSKYGVWHYNAGKRVARFNNKRSPRMGWLVRGRFADVSDVLRTANIIAKNGVPVGLLCPQIAGQSQYTSIVGNDRPES